MLDYLKEYFKWFLKWIWKRKMIIGAFLLYVIVLALLAYTKHVVLVLGWFIFAVIIGLSTNGFYWDYKKSGK